jgi:hypothetical protein
VKPTKDDRAVVDIVDVLLEDGAVLAADVVVSVAEVPLIGIQLRLLLAGMTRMEEAGVLSEWDREIRERALDSKNDTNE